MFNSAFIESDSGSNFSMCQCVQQRLTNRSRGLCGNVKWAFIIIIIIILMSCFQCLKTLDKIFLLQINSSLWLWTGCNNADVTCLNENGAASASLEAPCGSDLSHPKTLNVTFGK